MARVGLPDKDHNDCGVAWDADQGYNGDVHPQRVNEPVGGGVDDVTIAQPMRVQIQSAVIVTLSPRGHVGGCDWLVAVDDVRDVGWRWR